MTDISDLRVGDEIEVVIRARVEESPHSGDALIARLSDGSFLYVETTRRVSKSFTVVRPEIIPGKPYVDADGKLYVGKSGDRVVHVNAEGRGIYHGVGPEQRPLPAGLRAAKVVPES